MLEMFRKQERGGTPHRMLLLDEVASFLKVPTVVGARTVRLPHPPAPPAGLQQRAPLPVHTHPQDAAGGNARPLLLTAYEGGDIQGSTKTGNTNLRVHNASLTILASSTPDGYTCEAAPGLPRHGRARGSLDLEGA